MRYLLLIFAVACGARTSRPEQPPVPDEKQFTCSGADLSVSSSAQCERGACYQLADGTWCTNRSVRW